jgi:fimbrial isopeptide formation D2 family protein/LPXTG-motif cell wall-anchored protein
MFKKKIALLAAVVMMMSVAAPARVYAAPPSDGRVTLSIGTGYTSQYTMLGQAFEAYRLLDLVTNGAYEVNTAFTGLGVPTDIAPTPENLVEYIAWWALNDRDIQGSALMNALVGAVSPHGITPLHTSTAALAESVEFTGLEYGYYFILGKIAASGGGGETAVRVLVKVESDAPVGIDIAPKADVPSITKTIGGASVTNAAIGDAVPYTITGAVPNTAAYSAGYNYEITDILGAGLTLSPDSIRIVISGAALSSASAAAIITTSADGVRFLMNKALFEDAVAGYAPGDPILITYEAILNENAFVGPGGNVNTATLRYTKNTSNASDTETSADVSTTVYTYGAEVFKFTGDLSGTPGTDYVPLSGAAFLLLSEARVNTDATYDGKYIVAVVADGASPTAFRVAMASEGALTMATEASLMTTQTDGYIYVRGLAAGAYYLHEVTAPPEYAPLVRPVEFALTDADDDGAIEPMSPFTVSASNDGTISINIENARTSPFPDTGGIGRTIMFVAGGAVMLGALILLSIRRKVTGTKTPK